MDSAPSLIPSFDWMRLPMNQHFCMLARYNRIANERLYESCAQLDAAEYRRLRRGSFGSIHGLLNHILLGDQIWMSRFTGIGGGATPPLNTILFESLNELRAARVQEDAKIEIFFQDRADDFLKRTF